MPIAAACFERELRRLVLEPSLNADGVLGEGSAPDAEHFVAGPEDRHALSDGLHDPRHVGAADRRCRGLPAQLRDDREAASAVHQVPVERVYRCRVHADEHVAVGELRAIDLPDVKHVRGARPLLHEGPIFTRFRCTGIAATISGLVVLAEDD